MVRTTIFLLISVLIFSSCSVPQPIDCGDDPLCMNDQLLVCSSATYEVGSLLYTINGKSGNNCIVFANTTDNEIVTWTTRPAGLSATCTIPLAELDAANPDKVENTVGLHTRYLNVVPHTFGSTDTACEGPLVDWDIANQELRELQFINYEDLQ